MWHHNMWPMPETQDCNAWPVVAKVLQTFCVNFVRGGLGFEGKSTLSLSFSHSFTTSLSYLLSPSLFLSISRSQSFTISLCHSLSVCLSSSFSPSLSLPLSLFFHSRLPSVCLSVCLSLPVFLFAFSRSLSVSLSLSLLSPNELVIRHMHGAGSAKVSQQELFSRAGRPFGNKEFLTVP